MPQILLPKELHPGYRAGVKPTVPVTIDWNNPLSQGLVRFWFITEAGAIDLVSLGNDGVVDAGVTLQPYQGEMAGDFDSTVDHIAVTATGLPAGTSPRSILARFNSPSGGNKAIFGYGSSGSIQEFMCTIEASTVNVRVTGGSGTWNQNYNDGDWHNICFYLPGPNLNTVNLSVDGQTITRASASSVTLATTAVDARIGRRSYSTSFQWVGGISFVAVYNRNVGEAAANALTVNPYQVLRPTTPIVYFTPEGAPPVARRRFVITG